MQGNFISSTLFVFIFQVIRALFIIASGAAIARFLGPEGKGIVSLMTSFSILTATVACLSLEGGLAYYLSRHKLWLRSSFLLAITFAFSLWGIATSFLLIFKKILSDTFLESLVGYPFVIIIALIGIVICNRLLVGILQGLQFFRILLVPQSVTSLLLFSSLILLYVLGELSILNALLAYAFFPVIILIIYTSNILYTAWKIPRRKSEGMWRKVLIFSLKQHFGTIFREVNYRLDYLILAYFLSVDKLGFYSVAVGLSELIWHIPMAVGLTTFPRIAQANYQKGCILAIQTVRLTLIISILAGILFLIIGPVLIKVVFGSKFTISITPFMILLPSAVAMAIAKVVLTNLSGLGKPEYQSINAFFVLFVSVFLSLILIPKYGIVGAAVAKSVGYSLAFILGMIWFTKTTKSSLTYTLLPQKGDWDNIKKMIGKLYGK